MSPLLKMIIKISMFTKCLWCFSSFIFIFKSVTNRLMIGYKPESIEVISDLLNT